MGSEDAAPPEFAGFCKCLYNICCELQNLVSIAKVSAPLVFAEVKEYNKRRFGNKIMCMLDEIRAKRDEIYAVARAHKAEKLWVFGSCVRKMVMKFYD